MNRRQFGWLSSLSIASLLLSSWTSCNKDSSTGNALLDNLRGILTAADKALGLLQSLTPIPEGITMAVNYLLAVCKFVEETARLLQDETMAAVDKVKQILEWASAMGVPTSLPGPVKSILDAVQAAVDKFLSYFSATVATAGGIVRTEKEATPDLNLDKKQRKVLDAIAQEAIKEQAVIKQWTPSK